MWPTTLRELEEALGAVVPEPRYAQPGEPRTALGKSSPLHPWLMREVMVRLKKISISKKIPWTAPARDHSVAPGLHALQLMDPALHDLTKAFDLIGAVTGGAERISNLAR